MNRNLVLLILCQGLFFTNNVTFIAINGLVGLGLAPVPWMATLPVMGYVVGGAMSTGLVARTQARFGRRVSFQLGLVVAILSALLCALGVWLDNFWLVVVATFVAGYYSANGQLYRFAATEVVDVSLREKAISWVLAGGLIGAVVGPNLARYTKDAADHPFLGAYIALAIVGVLAMVCMQGIQFAEPPHKKGDHNTGRPMREIARRPIFIVSTLGAAIGYGIMNLLMAATPLAMKVDGFHFSDTAVVLQCHVIGMFAPGFFTGNLIKRFGALEVMAAGMVLNLLCILIAVSGNTFEHYVVALTLLGVGWNFLFTGSTSLATRAYEPEERDKAQGAINFIVFVVMAVTSFSSGALVTTRGWHWLNVGSLVPVIIVGVGLAYMFLHRSRSQAAAS
jgi:MFS family permease